MTDNDSRDPVDVLAEDYAARLRAGERPSVSDYAARHPDLADQLRELLPAVAQIEGLKRFRRDAGELVDVSLPERLGDFRLVRELGRGGMGVVYEAVQESLGRRVALKLLGRHALTQPGRRERFVREAQAAARLHHTNVVPVFGVGEHDGLPYFVMQLIPGRGLHAVIRGWQAADPGRADAATRAAAADDTSPTTRRPRPAPAAADAKGEWPRFGDWRFVAAAGAEAADALQYAHDHGVLHRDVKPANLLLDDDGTVWVADFGLAKLMDAPAGLTATGDVLGTLHYLAPECLAGRADARSDVYGLGATLYELLTLRPPVDGPDTASLLKRIGERDPVPPRAVAPGVPRDLETVVLTALARDPDHRYQTAAALADDLRAAAAGRPIQARRAGPAGRAWRWCRRNPAVALLSASTLAAGLAAGAAGWVGYARTTAALAAEAARRQEAEAASAKLSANLRLSLESFERLFEAVSAGGPRGGPPPGGPPGPPPGGPPGPPPGELSDRTAVLESVLAFFDKFAEQNATNSGLQFEAAKAHRRVAEVNRWLGRPDKADASFRRATGLLERLRAEFPDSDAVRLELLAAYTHAPKEAFGDGGWAAAERAVGELVDAVRAGGRGPRPPLAEAYQRLGWVREQLGDAGGAERAYRDAVAQVPPADPPGRGGPPRPPDPRPAEFRAVERGRAVGALADFLLRHGRGGEAKGLLTASVAELRPYQRFSRDLLANQYRRLADVYAATGDPHLADEARREAAALAQPPGGEPRRPPTGGPTPPRGRPDGPPRPLGM